MGKKKVLVLELGGIGDVIMALPALGALVGSSGDLYIKALTVKRTAPIVEQIRGMHKNRFDVEGADLLERRGLLPWLSLIKRLRREGYDVVIDLSAVEGFAAAIRRFIFLKLLSADELIGRDTEGLGWAFTKAVFESLTSDMHEVERKIEVVNLLGIEVKDKRPRIITRQKEREWSENLLLDFTGKGPVIGINPCAYRPSRMWRQEGFKEIAKWLIKELGASVVITGGERERAIIEAVARELAEDKVRLCVDFPIPRLCAMIERLDLFVTNDTGPMHIAAALNTPVVALFGQTNLWRYRPYMDEGRYITIKKDASICPHIRFKDKMEECRRFMCNGQECMEVISVDEVKAAIMTLIERIGVKQ